ASNASRTASCSRSTPSRRSSGTRSRPSSERKRRTYHVRPFRCFSAPRVDTHGSSPYHPGPFEETMRKAFLKTARETLEKMKGQLLAEIQQDLKQGRE